MGERRTSRSYEHDHTKIPLGRLQSGEWVWGDFEAPDIQIPESDQYDRERLLRDVLRKVSSAGYNDGIFFETVTLEEYGEVGFSRCVKTTPQNCIVYLYRPNKDQQTRFVLDAEPTPTDKVTVVIKKSGSKDVKLIAAYFGEHVNREPRGPHDWKATQDWEGQAIILDGHEQVDFKRKINLTDERGMRDPARTISPKSLQDLYEQKQRELLVRQTITYMATGSYITNYIDLETITEQHELNRLIREGLANEAHHYAQQQLGPFVAVCLIKLLLEGGYKCHHPLPRFSRWDELDAKQRKQLEFLGKGTVPFREDESDKTKSVSLIRLLGDAGKKEDDVLEIHKAKLREAEIKLDKALKQAKARVVMLIQDLYERKDEPEVVKAASSWTNAPDGDGYLGPRGEGLSGGYAHIFLYQAHKKKRKRFRDLKVPMTVEGFIALTTRLMEQVKLAEEVVNKSEEPTQNDLVVLRDAYGRRRYYILQPDKELIIAYQKGGQDTKISTVIPKYSFSSLRNAVATAVSEKDKIRINKLGPRIEIEFSNVEDIGY
jgi:hypothetical protein